MKNREKFEQYVRKVVNDADYYQGRFITSVAVLLDSTLPSDKRWNELLFPRSMVPLFSTNCAYQIEAVVAAALIAFPHDSFLDTYLSSYAAWEDSHGVITCASGFACGSILGVLTAIRETDIDGGLATLLFDAPGFITGILSTQRALCENVVVGKLATRLSDLASAFIKKKNPEFGSDHAHIETMLRSLRSISNIQCAPDTFRNQIMTEFTFKAFAALSLDNRLRAALFGWENTF